MSKKILSLFDYTGTWPQPYKEAGYEVICLDIKNGDDVFDVDAEWVEKNGPFQGIMAAVPCTDFSVSGAQYWPAKDEDGRTEQSVALLNKTLQVIKLANPEWWVIENPVGRIKNWIGKPKLYFNPCDFGGYLAEGEKTHDMAPAQDAYTKKTGLWGNFNEPKKIPVEPQKSCKQGSWLQKLGGKSEKTKYLRSITPLGFSRAFFQANQ